MREISVKEANRLGGETISPVICKVENEITESAVCLKKLPAGFLLGISSETRDCLQLFLFDTKPLALKSFQKHVSRMDDTGFPFLD